MAPKKNKPIQSQRSADTSQDHPSLGNQVDIDPHNTHPDDGDTSNNESATSSTIHSNATSHTFSNQQAMEFMATFSKRFESLENSNQVLFSLILDMKNNSRGANDTGVANGKASASSASTPKSSASGKDQDHGQSSAEEESEKLPSNDTAGMTTPIQKENSSLMYTNLVNSILHTIPPFDGKPEEYTVFKQQFDMLVHEKEEIPDTMKHVLLLRLLTGELKNRMRSTNISTKDYETLRSNLERQFNRNNDNKQRFLKQLKRFVFDEYDFDKMQADLDKFSIIINNMRNIGCATDDPVVVDIFINKLPSIIMNTVFKKNRQRERSLEELMDIAHDTIAEKRALAEAEEQKKSKAYTNEVYVVQEAAEKQATYNQSHDPNLFRSEEGLSSESD